MSDETEQPLSDFDRQCIQAFQLWEQLGRPEDPKVVANALDLPRHTVSNRLLKFFTRNLGQRLPVALLPGMEITAHNQQFDRDGNLKGQTFRAGPATSDEPFEMPDGFRLHRGTYQVNARGHVERQWLKTVEDGQDPQAIIDSIRMAAEEAASAQAEAARQIKRAALHTDGDAPASLLNLHPLPDLHLGLYVWGKHCGVSWDLKKAITTIKATMVDLAARAPAARHGVILGGGDLLHADDETKKTRRSGHVLDVDGRYAKVLKEAELLLVFQVELALAKYETVEVRVLPGNHDDDSAVACTHFLAAWFRNEPRVTVSDQEGAFWFRQHGRTMLCGTHGHETKIENMKDVAAADEAEMWGTTRHRYAHGFHYHSKRAGEQGGMEWETHRTPIPRDAYAHDNGFRSGRSMQVITYHAETGEEGRTSKNL